MSAPTVFERDGTRTCNGVSSRRRDRNGTRTGKEGKKLNGNRHFEQLILIAYGSLYIKISLAPEIQ